MNVNINQKIYQNPYENGLRRNICNNRSTNSSVSFSAKKDEQNSSILKKVAPYIIGGTLFCSPMITSCTNNRISGTENINDTKVEYFNIKPESKDSLIAPLFRLKSKLNKDNDFLKGVNINFTDTYDDLNDSHSLKTFLKEQYGTGDTKGISYYSDKKIPRIIVVQEGAHGIIDKFFNYTMNGNLSEIPTLKHSLMHEIGHQFDYYFGHDHNAKFAKDFDNMMYKKEKDPYQNPYSYDFQNDEEENIEMEYRLCNCLNDKDDFKQALLKDLKYIAELQKHNPDRIPVDIEYYAKDIDFSKPITQENVDLAEKARTETYANLFAYAMGEDNGDKKDFLNAFRNSYKVVCNDIQQKLGINVLQQ